MYKFPSIFFLIFFSILLNFRAQGQFKRIYTPDTSTLKNVSFFTSMEVVETDIPGKEIAFTGSVTGQDSSGNFIQASYLMQCDWNGLPRTFSHFNDTSAFVLLGGRGYALCYDGMGHYYVATGSNDKQVAVKVDSSGNMLWAMRGSHHDFYSVVCEGHEAVFMGQDESLIGVHDYSLIRLDSGGSPVSIGMMYGTVNFDVPQSVVATSDGYIMAGSAYNQGFSPMIIKTDTALNMQWGRVLNLPGRAFSCNDVVTLAGGEGYAFTGKIRKGVTGSADSLFVMKVDTSGQLNWCKIYGADSLIEMDGLSIDTDPLTGNLITGGSFKANGYSKSFVLLTDPDGNFIWARDYSDFNTNAEEFLNDLSISSDGQHFIAVGNHSVIDSNFMVERSVFVIRAKLSDGKLPCDTNLLLGSNEVFPVDGDIIFTEPFSTNAPYPYKGGFAQMNTTVKCSTMVGLEQEAEPVFEFDVIKSGREQIKVRYALDILGGELTLRDLQGRLLWQQKLEPGQQEVKIQSLHLVQGIYVLSLQSPDWIFETKKILIY